MKVFAKVFMVLCYILTIAGTVNICYQVGIGKYFTAFCMSILGLGMFMTAEILRKEWREGRL
jgi:hypothetical protein